MLHRRQLLAASAFSAASLSLAAAPAGATASQAERRFVFLLLRGGLDGLYAVPAVGDPHFAEARGALARFEEAPLPLHGPFALHPALAQMHRLYGQGELAVVHATGLPYRERSHFDAQQVLESGGNRPYELATGWLARALNARGGPPTRAVALDTAVPLALRGTAQVDTWAPSVLPEPNADLLQRLQALYAGDPALAQALARAQGLRQNPEMDMAAMKGMGGGGGGGRNAVLALGRQACEFLQKGAQVAVLEMGGWDSHSQQANPNGPLNQQLRTLDALVATLRDGLQAGGTWGRTVVLVTTEFGREVAANGTGGSDHGSGGAAFVLGGAVRGGQVIADWPGLAKADRFEGRDLKTTTDLRAVQRSLLAQHLGLGRAALDSTVLPGSAGLSMLDLVRG
ncbi:MAG: DUF1501 domain-containing protein [Rubrivivax sp.]|jgi:uncharacterized protein (DUF1501 family)